VEPISALTSPTPPLLGRGISSLEKGKDSLLHPQIERVIDAALAEDLSWGDITTETIVPPDMEAKGFILVKREGVVAGLEIASAVFKKVDPQLKVNFLVSDGTKVKPGTIIAEVEGKVRSILKAERTALNFLCRLSGIATETAKYVSAISGLPCIILDTRKTAPGMRLMDKYAVRMGGGKNHRFHLGDGILIKDNHWFALRSAGLSLKQAIERARSQAHHLLKLEVEVKDEEEAKEALQAGADILLLDNMSIEEMKRVVEIAKGKALLEASGGITLDNIREVAETGVDFISIGSLTHSPKALDISLELEI